MIWAVLLSLLLSMPLWAQSRDFDVTPSGGWLDTGINVNAGDTLHVTATGQLQYTNARQPNGPAGLPRGFTDVVQSVRNG